LSVFKFTYPKKESVKKMKLKNFIVIFVFLMLFLIQGIPAQLFPYTETNLDQKIVDDIVARNLKEYKNLIIIDLNSVRTYNISSKSKISETKLEEKTYFIFWKYWTLNIEIKEPSIIKVENPLSVTAITLGGGKASLEKTEEFYLIKISSGSSAKLDLSFNIYSEYPKPQPKLFNILSFFNWRR